MAGTLDQSFTTNNDSNGMRAGGSTKYAQSFTPTQSGGVSEIRLGLNQQGSPTGNIWVEIWSNSGGSPGSIIGSQSSNVDVSTIGGSFPTLVEKSFTFASPPAITAGTKYWIVVNGDWTISGTNFVFVYNNSSGGYTGGEAYEFTGSWAAFGSRDLYFKQYYAITYTATFNETVTVSDTLTKLIGLVRSETVTLSEVFTRLTSRIFSETITLSEVFTAIKLQSRTFTDNITVSETFTRVISKVFSDTATLSEVFTKLRTTIKTFTETSITISDTMIRTFGRTVRDTITISEAFNSLKNGVNTIWTKIARTASTWTKKGRNQ